MNELDALVEGARAAFAQAATPAELENAKALYLGKSGRITELMKGMAALPVEEKKTRRRRARNPAQGRSARREPAGPPAWAGWLAPGEPDAGAYRGDLRVAGF